FIFLFIRNIFFVFTPLFVRRERIIPITAMRDLPPLMALLSPELGALPQVSKTESGSWLLKQ
ncbi:MAG: hypothetical protein VW174_03050, partial [Candidatus Puniceispirillum sp.]